MDENEINMKLIIASGKGCLEDVINLLENGAELNPVPTDKNPWTPLHNACSGNDTNENVKVCKTLIDHGADVNSWDGAGRTPLCVAAFWNNVEIGKLLLDNGAEIDKKNSCDDTPLYIAVRWGNFEFCKMLIERNAELNIKCDFDDSETPLSLAEAYADDEMYIDPFDEMPMPIEKYIELVKIMKQHL